MLSTTEIDYIVKLIGNSDLENPPWFDWDGLRENVNVKFAHQPKLTDRMFLCAIHHAKDIGPVYDEKFLKWMAGAMEEELREAKDQKG